MYRLKEILEIKIVNNTTPEKIIQLVNWFRDQHKLNYVSIVMDKIPELYWQTTLRPEEWIKNYDLNVLNKFYLELLKQKQILNNHRINEMKITRNDTPQAIVDLLKTFPPIKQSKILDIRRIISKYCSPKTLKYSDPEYYKYLPSHECKNLFKELLDYKNNKLNEIKVIKNIDLETVYNLYRELLNIKSIVKQRDIYIKLCQIFDKYNFELHYYIYYVFEWLKNLPQEKLYKIYLDLLQLKNKANG